MTEHERSMLNRIEVLERVVNQQRREIEDIRWRLDLPPPEYNLSNCSDCGKPMHVGQAVTPDYTRHIHCDRRGA